MLRGAVGRTMPAALLAAGMALALIDPAAGDAIVHPERPYEESVEVVRRFVTVRLDPKRLAPRDACATLTAGDLVARIGGVPSLVTNIERMPRPSVIWLLLDTSRSLELVHDVVKRDARRILRELAQPDGTEVALVTIDEDTRLLSPPSDDYERLAAAIDGVPEGGQSFLRDGLAEILGQIAGDRREHLVIFWTDGVDRFSVRSPEAVEAALAAAPHARLLPIGFPALDRGAAARLLDGLYFRLARRSGGAVYRTGGDWLEQLRESFSRRWVVTVVPPPGVAAAAPLVVASATRQCRISVLEIAEEPGVPPGTPPAWEDTWRRQRRNDDAGPCRPSGPMDKPWHRPPQGAPGRIDGCTLDIVREPGILYRDHATGHLETLSPLKLASRPWTVAVPAFEDLARAPGEALDRWARESDDERSDVDSPRIIHGRTFLSVQGRIARAMWETQPEMRAFAERVLAVEAERGIATAAAAIRIGAPELRREQAETAARASPEGRRLLAAADSPGDGDLRRILAAWLGDVGARELFESWERLLAGKRLDEQLSVAEAERLWATARSRFALPERARTLALLVPGRNGAEGPAGFWRIVLPRAVWIFDRRAGDSEAVPYDHVPERPLGLLALDRVLKNEPKLSRSGLRVVAIAYEPLVETWREDPARPFGRGIVRVTLGRDDDVDGHAPRVIEAAFESRRSAPPEIVRLDVR